MNNWYLDKTNEQSNSSVGDTSKGYIEVTDNTIYFYGGVTTEKMLHLLKHIKDKEQELLSLSVKLGVPDLIPLRLRIQSYGGSAHAAFSMYDHLKSLQVPLHTYIDGVAASAGTILSVAGGKRFIQPNAFMLIHQVSFRMWGSYTHENMKDEIKNSEGLMKVIKNIYLEETKIPEKKLEEILKHDLYFTAEESVEYGLVDDIM